MVRGCGFITGMATLHRSERCPSTSTRIWSCWMTCLSGCHRGVERRSHHAGPYSTRGSETPLGTGFALSLGDGIEGAGPMGRRFDGPRASPRLAGTEGWDG